MLPITTFYMNDQRTAILDLVQAGVLENHPNLKIIATHLGGGVLGLMGRIEQLAEVLPAEQLYIDLRGQKKKLPNLINYYLKKIYYDCNNADATDIIAAAGKVGIDHLLTGTDFPFIPESFTRLVLANCPFSEKEKEAIAYNNAARLFGMNPIDQ
jgi:predicted TIM-barrel fold metal-dependent hydrolase